MFKGNQEKLKKEREARWGRVDESLKNGLSPKQIASEEGVTPGAISRQARRHGRKDLAMKFDRTRSTTS